MTRVEGSAQRGPVEKTGTLTTIATITNTPPARMTQGMSPSSHSPLDPSKGERPTRERAELFAGILGFFFLLYFFTFLMQFGTRHFCRVFCLVSIFCPSSSVTSAGLSPGVAAPPGLTTPGQHTPTKLHAARQSVGSPTVPRLLTCPPPMWSLVCPWTVAISPCVLFSSSSCWPHPYCLLFPAVLPLLRDMEGPCTSSRICWGQ